MCLNGGKKNSRKPWKKKKDVKLGRDFTERDPNPKEAFKICEVLDIPLLPRWSYH